MTDILSAVLIAIACSWILCAILTLLGARSLRPFRRTSSPPEPSDGWPLVSIVVPCRNEIAGVNDSIDSLLAQNYPALEIIAVDDRSDDGTGEVLDALAARDARLRVLHLTELPDGWLGKPHALHAGSLEARGEWILFSDGDVVHDPELLRHAIAHTAERRLDYLTLLPHNETASIFVQGAMVFAYISIIILFGLWTRWRKEQGWITGGTGAFIVMRTATYRSLGGHESLRLAVVDDMALGVLASRRGVRCEIRSGLDWCRVPWATTFREFLAVTRKNAFATVGYFWPALIGLTLLQTVLSTVAPLAILFVPGLWPWAASLWASLALSFFLVAPLAGAPRWIFVFHPFTSLTLQIAGWLSAIETTRRGGIEWRDRFYPLRDLRAGGRLRARDAS